MQVSTSVYYKNQTRSRRVFNAITGEGWAVYVEKTLADTTVAEVKRQSLWKSTGLSDLSWSLARYWVELARNKMPAWTAEGFTPYIQVVTGSLSKSLQPRIQAQARAGILSPFIAEIAVDFAPADVNREEHSLMGAFPAGANVSLGIPLAEYRPETLEAVLGYLRETEEEVKQLIHSLFSAQEGQRAWVAGLLKMPDFIQASSSWQAFANAFSDILARIDDIQDDLRTENEQRIQAAAQNRIQAALDKQREKDGE